MKHRSSIGVVLLGGACTGPTPATETTPETTLAPGRTIGVMAPAPDGSPPEAAGREAFASSCLMCHSFDYVVMQPPFPAQTWTKLVDKMKSAYGAPFAPELAPQIVDYLTAINGTP